MLKIKSSLDVKTLISNFIADRGTFLYKFDLGLYMAFDSTTLEYIGVEMKMLLTLKEFEEKLENSKSKLLEMGLVEKVQDEN